MYLGNPLKCSCQLTWLQNLEAASSSSNVRQSIKELNCSLDGESETMVISLAQVHSTLKCDSTTTTAMTPIAISTMKKTAKRPPPPLKDGVIVNPSKPPPSVNDSSASSSLHLSAQGISIQSEESVSVTTSVLSSSQSGHHSSSVLLSLVISFLLSLLITFLQ